MEQLAKLQKIIEHADKDFIQKDEFKTIFDFMVSVLKEVRVYLEGEMSKTKKETIATTLSNMNGLERKMSDLMKSKCSMADMKEAVKGVMSEIERVKEDMSYMVNLDVLEAKLTQIEASIPANEKENPEEIRDSLESIRNENDKLKIEAISGLRKELDDMKKNIMARPRGFSFFGGGGSGGGRIVKSYDLSSQLNGSLRTFSTPAMWRPISIHLSSFPSILRETVDFTWTDKSITITGEIPDNSLSTGQTLILVYSEV